MAGQAREIDRDDWFSCSHPSGTFGREPSLQVLQLGL